MIPEPRKSLVWLFISIIAFWIVVGLWFCFANHVHGQSITGVEYYSVPAQTNAVRIYDNQGYERIETIITTNRIRVRFSSQATNSYALMWTDGLNPALRTNSGSYGHSWYFISENTANKTPFPGTGLEMTNDISVLPGTSSYYQIKISP